MMGRAILWIGIKEQWEEGSPLPSDHWPCCEALLVTLLSSPALLRTHCIPLPRSLGRMLNSVGPQQAPLKNVTSNQAVNCWSLILNPKCPSGFPAHLVVHSACPYFYFGCKNIACQKPCKSQGILSYCYSWHLFLYIFLFFKTPKYFKMYAKFIWKTNKQKQQLKKQKLSQSLVAFLQDIFK